LKRRSLTREAKTDILSGVKRLFLLDGTALAYRSHFALARSGLATTDGIPTGATYGFTMALRRILEQEKPDLIAVALDAKGPTFRHKQFADYKATREKAPEELIAQLDFIRDVVNAHGIPLFEIPGFEADDVIGTLAKQGEAAGFEVMLVSGDKDFMQLVSERVQLYNIFKPGIDLVVQGIDAVKEKFGTTPDNMIQVLAIMGDASDNIPGVKGIGEKGAIKLISEFDTIAGVLENLDKLTPKQREKIEDSREMLLLSLDLVTIDTAVPLEPGFDSLTEPAPDPEKLSQVFKRLDFQSLATKVMAVAEDEIERDYNTIGTEAELKAMVAELIKAGTFAMDTETTSLFSMQAELVGASFSAAEGRAFYVPFNSDPPLFEENEKARILESLEPLFSDESLFRIGQNYKYDQLVLISNGACPAPPNFDTMVASFCIAGAGRRHNLDSLALYYFNIQKIPTKELIGSGAKQITMAEVPVKVVAEYACEDADVTFRLYERLNVELEENGVESLFHELEMPLVNVLARMEERGVRLNTTLLEGLSEAYEIELLELSHTVQEFAGRNFNLNSTKVLGTILFEELRIQDAAGVKKPKKTKTGWATDAATLTEKYPGVPIVAKLLEYREVNKLKSTYIDALPRYVNPKTGRIHCSFSQVAAATGRLASSDPNLQNIPVRSERGRKLREAFIPREADDKGTWEFLAADYSQIELRVMAHYCGDEKMIAAFERGDDIHAATAATLFGVFPELVDRTMRSQAKVINFGLLYGMGPQRVARETDMSVPEALKFIERYFAAFPRIRDWIEAVKESARENGFVETMMGRRRQTPDIHSANARVRATAENVAVNTPIQGSAADIIKRAMIDLHERLEASNLSAQLLLQVHDELILEVPTNEFEETEALVRECMEQAVQLKVPLVVECGRGANWLEAH
jgi:DNA polymerase-1